MASESAAVWSFIAIIAAVVWISFGGPVAFIVIATTLWLAFSGWLAFNSIRENLSNLEWLIKRKADDAAANAIKHFDIVSAAQCENETYLSYLITRLRCEMIRKLPMNRHKPSMRMPVRWTKQRRRRYKGALINCGCE